MCACSGVFVCVHFLGGGGDGVQAWTFVVPCVNGLLVEMSQLCVCRHLHVRMKGLRRSAWGVQGDTHRGKQSAPAIVS